jgi:hypothetical protein
LEVAGDFEGFPRSLSIALILTVTFIASRSSLENMQDILSSKRMENGIVVFWEEKGEKKNESFNYSELIDMKINALDLLDRPKSYKVDTAAHQIISQKIPKKS